MGLLGDVGDPKKDVAAIAPLADHLIDRIKNEILPALTQAVIAAGADLYISISIEKKEQS